MSACHRPGGHQRSQCDSNSRGVGKVWQGLLSPIGSQQLADEVIELRYILLRCTSLFLARLRHAAMSAIAPLLEFKRNGQPQAHK